MARFVNVACLPCAIGAVEGGGESYGHSLFIDPWGDILAGGGTRACVPRATIDLDQVAAARARIPSLDHDRPFASPESGRRNAT